MDTHAAYLSRERFPSLDGLRCLAILPVVWHHSTPRPLPGALGRGPLGVHLFFAVSGFLITTLLLRERRRMGDIAFGAFFMRRALRIFPLYYGVLALYTLRGWLFLPESPMRTHFLHNLPWFATYTTNWMVDFDVPHPVIFGFSWSLATEEQFYLTWPWVLRWSRSWRIPVVFLVALLAIDSAAEHGLLSAVIGTQGALVNIVTSVSAPICLGALLAIALDAPLTYRLLAALFGHVWSAPVALAGLTVLVALDGAPLLGIHVAMVVLLAAVCIRETHGLQVVLEASPVRHVGVTSYGIYLFHVAMITLVKGLLPAAWRSAPLVFALAFALAIALATISYRYLERPLLALRQRFRPGLQGNPAASGP